MVPVVPVAPLGTLCAPLSLPGGREAVCCLHLQLRLELCLELRLSGRHEGGRHREHVKSLFWECRGRGRAGGRGAQVLEEGALQEGGASALLILEGEYLLLLQGRALLHQSQLGL